MTGRGRTTRGRGTTHPSKEPGRPTPLAEALAGYLRTAGLARRVGQAGVLEEWPVLVGPQIARVTRAESVSAEGQLRVRVATAAWAAELQLMTPQILARVNAGRQGRIRGIRWLAGGMEPGPSGPRTD
jgi:predicted nucleic acid-binding Zn ribbon protein